MMYGSNFTSTSFHKGTDYKVYEYLGVTLSKDNDKFIYTFRTWAPSAVAVRLISDFVGWETPIPLKRVTKEGIWELIYCSDTSLEGMAYKFRITSSSGIYDKGDPFARYSKGGRDGSSIIYTENTFVWGDKLWLDGRRRSIKRRKKHFLPVPINIYEMHIGSFARHEGDNSYYSYRELAEILPSYLKSLGYTHVEFLPVAEHPYDGSWGYQVCSPFAPTSRFGSPDDFRYLVNRLHESGVGVILDWVPAHFPKVSWGLYEFDGSPLYEYSDKKKQESRSWGTRFFNLGREEVQSYLISSALYFLREFHIDGLRVDAVASMIYLDFDRAPTEWTPNEDGTNENREATAFLRKLNQAILDEFPDVLMIAEESGSYIGVTKPVSDGGLGFTLKWNMGFANDFYDYMSTDPFYRKYKHRALNFPIMYAFTDNYCLPISHDEVVHGKKSFINKMYGACEDKFSQARSAMLMIMTFPGKKLLFMGTEYAQFKEWDFDNSLEWFMLDYPDHKLFRDYIAALNNLYLSSPELWEIDFDSDGFNWIYPDEADKNLIAYRRFDSKGNFFDIVINFSGATQEIRIPITSGNSIETIFDTGDHITPITISMKTVKKVLYADLRLPKFSGIILRETKKSTK